MYCKGIGALLTVIHTCASLLSAIPLLALYVNVTFPYQSGNGVSPRLVEKYNNILEPYYTVPAKIE